MNPHVADKLFNELTSAEVAYRLSDKPIAEFLRKRAHKHHGEIKKHLLRIAALGPDANLWMSYFIDGMIDDENNTDFIKHLNL